MLQLYKALHMSSTTLELISTLHPKMLLNKLIHLCRSEAKALSKKVRAGQHRPRSRKASLSSTGFGV